MSRMLRVGCFGAEDRVWNCGDRREDVFQADKDRPGLPGLAGGAGGWGERRRQGVLAGWRWEHRSQEMPGRCVERAGAAKAVLGRGL